MDVCVPRTAISTSGLPTSTLERVPPKFLHRSSRQESLSVFPPLVAKTEIKKVEPIKNIIKFCDKIIILDNYSTDKTHEIIINIKNKFPNKIEYSRIVKISQSLRLQNFKLIQK